jgi:glycosyltransferase involved in cell wall biosynthesis
MKILVTAVSFSSKISGIQRHAFNLVRCLSTHPDVSSVHLILAPWQWKMANTAALSQDKRIEIHVEQVKQGSIGRNLWYYRSLPELAHRLQPDLIHLTYPMPIDATALRCAVVLTLHDLYPYEIPANFRFPHVLFNRLVLRQSLRNADAVACVSDATLAGLKRHTPESVWRNATRIYNCVESAEHEVQVCPLSALHGKPFLLCVAQHRRNKNIPLLLRVFSSLRARGDIDAATALLIVGIPGPETSAIHMIVAQRNLCGRVCFRDGLSDSELQWCYAHCQALIVPSTIEGFGLPVAEALLVGCRIICSDIPALQEIGREHCRYFELGRDQEESLAKSITTSLRQPKGCAIPLPHLSAQVLAEEYVSLYRQVLENHYASAATQADHSRLRDGSALREV